MAVLLFLLNLLSVFLSVVLIILVLLQRGRGGGLAGAFGGMGGQSAFGTKAGDVFTRITIVVAIIWLFLAGFSGVVARAKGTREGKSSQFLAPGAEDDTTGAATGGAAGSGAGTLETTDADTIFAPDGEQQSDAPPAESGKADNEQAPPALTAPNGTAESAPPSEPPVEPAPPQEGGETPPEAAAAPPAEPPASPPN